MKRIMMIVVVMVAVGFTPVSGFAQKNFNSSKSNTSTSIATSKTQADCKNADGVWRVDAQGKGNCMVNNARRTTAKFATGANRPAPPQGTTVPMPSCWPKGSGDPMKGLGTGSGGPKKNPCP